ncbi:MAG TPA: dihydrofolate reductase family protein [Gemmatimonadaceae bacterium]|nr:dihydrofolate reductase family protein [Gemmatimonadaceae bacterium]
MNGVSKLRFKISMSLDGFVAGPNQSVENPLGIGGMRLHEWVFALASWRGQHGLEGGEAAGGKDGSLAGGARAAQQCLTAGLVDEMEISLVPTLLCSGERLFDGVGDDLHGLELARTIAAPGVTHIKFGRR